MKNIFAENFGSKLMMSSRFDIVQFQIYRKIDFIEFFRPKN